MVGYCAAYGCKTREQNRSAHGSSSRDNDITFHYFPKDPTLCEKWRIALRRDNFRPTSSSRICSKHFKATDYDNDGFRRRLQRGVVPSVFSFPEHLQPKTPTPRLLVRHQSVDLKTTKKHQQPNPKYVTYVSVRHDHGGYVSSCDPLTKLKESQKEIGYLKKKLRAIKQCLNRKIKTTKRLKGMLKQVRDMNLIEKEAFSKLTEAFGDDQSILFKHMISATKAKKAEYMDKIKAFAVTLHYLSPKAYIYLRPVLKLPHPATLRTWQSSVYCQPGYLDNMLSLAAKRVNADEEASRFCSLIIDEMSIHKDISWCQHTHRYVGFEDYGGGPVVKSIARNALVFLLVSLKQCWKIPMAYFLTDTMDSEQLQRTISQAIARAADFGLLVKTVVADGLTANMKAGKLLGCNFTPENLQTSFQHPTISTEKVYYICDPPHMLKLIRNFLGEKRIIKRLAEDGSTELIQWHYLELLLQEQNSDSLYLANKLYAHHIHFNNVKMKVNVAAQTLSSSVASTIDHLREDCNLPQFQGSKATTTFLRFFDKLFDCLNSKNPYAKSYKAALTKWNQQSWEHFLLTEVPAYLKSLQDESGRNILKSQMCQGVLGFLITSKSAACLAMEILEKGTMDYILPYKFSQDHIEMFFRKIRQRNGNNDNPSSEKFKSALKTLMLQNEVSASSFGNATSFGDDSSLCLEFSSRPQQLHIPSSNPPEADFEMEEAAKWLESLLFSDQDWRQSCLVYTAGFVVRRLREKISCSKCVSALTTDDLSQTSRNEFSFLNKKNNGGLVKPSEGVIQVISTSDKAFRRFMPDPEHMTQLPSIPHVDLHIQRCVLSAAKDKLTSWFPSLREHFFEHEVKSEESHVSHLVRSIVALYIRMRLLKAWRMHQRRIILQNKSSHRMKFTKLILYSSQ